MPRITQLESKLLPVNQWNTPWQRVWCPECVLGMSEDVIIAIRITSPEFAMMTPAFCEYEICCPVKMEE